MVRGDFFHSCIPKCISLQVSLEQSCKHEGGLVECIDPVNSIKLLSPTSFPHGCGMQWGGLSHSSLLPRGQIASIHKMARWVKSIRLGRAHGRAIWAYFTSHLGNKCGPNHPTLWRPTKVKNQRGAFLRAKYSYVKGTNDGLHRWVMGMVVGKLLFSRRPLEYEQFISRE